MELLLRITGLGDSRGGISEVQHYEGITTSKSSPVKVGYSPKGKGSGVLTAAVTCP